MLMTRASLVSPALARLRQYSAAIRVGAQVPFISNSLNTDVGGRNDSFQYKDVGVILEVTPQINSEEDVALSALASFFSQRCGSFVG